MRKEFVSALFLFAILLAQLVYADTISDAIIPIRACNAEDDAAAAGTFGGACDFPDGSALIADGGNTETHSALRSGTRYWGGVNTTSYNSTETECIAITSVSMCYEWWSSAAGQDCDISVDANGGASYTAVTTTCPLLVANPGVTCFNATATEAWSCSSFFGASGTRAQVKSEGMKTGGNGAQTYTWDVLYYNVTYRRDREAPVVTLISPGNGTTQAPGAIVFQYNVSDESTIANCSLIINSARNQTNTSVTRDATQNFTATLTAGSYTWSVNCTDNSTNKNNGSSATWNLTVAAVDTTNPSVTINSPSNDTFLNTTLIIINVTATDANMNYTNVSIINSTGSIVNSTTNTTNGTFVIQLGVPRDGVYNITATAYDLTGNSNISTRKNITVDTTKPSVAINSPASNAVLNSTLITINVTATDTNLNYTNISIINSVGSVVNSTTNTTNGTFVVSLTVPSDGVYNITATAYDKASNTNVSLISNITVDTGAPSVTINSPASNAFVNSTLITINVTATDTNLNYTNISIINSTGSIVNSTTNTTNGTFVIQLGVPRDGVYNITATAYDTTSKTSTATNSITVDTISPFIQITYPSNSSSFNTALLSINLTATDANLNYTNISLINNLGSIVSSITDTTNGSYSVQLAVPSNGVYNITATAYDKVGRTNTTTVKNVTITVPVCRVTNDTYGRYAGYSDYYIPGPADQLWNIFYDLSPTFWEPVNSSGLRSIISVTATLANTIVYYDHWENGYNFDSNNPTATADEIYNLSAGGVKIFESKNVSVSPRGNATFYDGGDRIFVSGGPVTVVRVSWPESTGTVYDLAYELYPVKALSQHYIIPVGQDLSKPPVSSSDFNRTYLMIQAIQNNTQVVVTDPTSGVIKNVTLNQGNTTTVYYTNSSTEINATHLVNVQFITGNKTKAYVARGYTAVPDNLWSTEYYNPVPSSTKSNTTLFMYNPTAANLTINYADKNGSGSFILSPGATRDYRNLTGRYVPQTSGVYLNSNNGFWAVGLSDTLISDYEWGYSLIPSYLLTQDYYLGWAPGSSNNPPTENGASVFITSLTARRTTIFVDYSPINGVAEANYTINRLDSLNITDPDFDLTGSRIWTDGIEPFAVAWGENPNIAGGSTPYMDIGYTSLPMPTAWIDPVLGIENTVIPNIIKPQAGQIANFTLIVSAFNYLVSNVSVYNTLPPGWVFVSNSAVITFANGTIISGSAANPSISGQNMTWTLGAPLGPCESLSITFQANSTSNISRGFNWDRATAMGYRNFNQVFTPQRSSYIFVPTLTIDKSTSTPGVIAGGLANFTIIINNTVSTNVTDVNVSDILPGEFKFINGSANWTNATRTITANPSAGNTSLFWGTWTFGSGGVLNITFTVNVSNSTEAIYENNASASTLEFGNIFDNGVNSFDTPLWDPGNDSYVTVFNNANLTVWDETDTVVKYISDPVTFYANYTRSVGNSPIANASCNISLDTPYGWTAPANMSYNATSGLYYYNRTFNFTGTYNFSVDCSKANVQPMNAISDYVISLRGVYVYTDQGTYSACNIIFYKIWVYDQNDGLLGANLSISIYNSSNSLQNTTSASTGNGGTGIYLGEYALNSTADLGEWQIIAIADNLVKGTRNFFVGTAQTKWKIDIDFTPDSIVYLNGTSITMNFTVWNKDGARATGLLPGGIQAFIDSTNVTSSLAASGEGYTYAYTANSTGSHLVNVSSGNIASIRGFNVG